ncbi:MAG: LPS export ABC transporter permease LptG [Desulfosalsimonadaceae bacterium]
MMTVVHRYIVSTFMKYFAIVLVMVVLIYLAIDFFSRADRFFASPVSGYDTFLYFVYKIPLIVSQITPIGVLLAVLIVFGLMSRNNELIALKSGGISVFYLLTPIVLLGIVFSVALFVFSEVAVPVSIARSNEIDSQRKGNERRGTLSSRKDIWIRHDQGLAHVQYFHPREEVLFGVSLYFMDEDYRLTRRIDAREAMYVDGQWVFFETMIQRMESPEADIQITHLAETRLELDLTPSDFQRVVVESEEMSFSALHRYIHRIETDGYDATEYRVDYYGKTAFPFVCLIMAVMGAAIALRGSTKDGMAVSFAYGIVLAFAYWSVYSFSLSMGYGGLLPPLLAAWTANILYGLGTALMLLYIE